MKKTNNTIRFLVETTTAISHLALKRGRLFAVGSSIPVRSIATPGKLKWLCAYLPSGSKKPWDQAHEISDKTQCELGQAAFVEPDAVAEGGESRYSKLMNPRQPSPLRSARSGKTTQTGLANRFGVSGLQRGTRPSSPFGPNVAGIGMGVNMGMPGIPDPLADIMPQIPGDAFGGNTLAEPFGDSDRVSIDLVRRALEVRPLWSGLTAAKQEMYVTEAAQLLASSKDAPFAFNSELLLESLKTMSEISGALLKFIS